MHKKATLAGMLVIFALIILQACGGSSNSSSNPQAAASTVNLVVHDTPPTNTTVLSFQIQITGAVLQPGNVKLLPRPVTVDLAQLVSDTSFLASTVVGSTTYTSLDLTFANPEITILNDTGAPIVTPYQTCPAAQVCTFTPPINPINLTISSGVFPLTLIASTPAGLNLDLSIPDILQSDLSLTFANGKSVNLSLLPPASSTGVQTQVDDVMGMVQSVGNNQVTIQTALGNTLVITAGSSTQYNFPGNVCASNNFSCLAANQIITTDLSLMGGGDLVADSFSYSDGAGASVAQGIIVSVSTGTPASSFQMEVHGALPSSSGLGIGDLVTVSLQSGAGFSVGTPGYPTVPNATFASGTDLTVGQEVQAEITGNLTATGAISFSTGRILLESSQFVGRASAIDSADGDFTATALSRLFSHAFPSTTQMQVQTGSSTNFVNLSPASLSTLTVGQNVGVKGPLFNTTSVSGSPSIGAIQVAARTGD